MLLFSHIVLHPKSRVQLKLHRSWFTRHRSKHHFKKTLQRWIWRYTLAGSFFSYQIEGWEATGISTHGSWRNVRRIGHADENPLKIKRFPSARVFPALDSLCFRGLVEWLNRLMRHYTNKSSLPTSHCLETGTSSHGHYGSWNVLCSRVNIWKCRKSDTVRCVDILIKAKGCFGPLSSVKKCMLEA